jgi:hypothetical protein
MTCDKYNLDVWCHNPNLGLATKARGHKVASQEGSPGGRPHAPESARECEGIDVHILKGTLTLGVEVSMDS